jgi:hypothetical protein
VLWWKYFGKKKRKKERKKEREKEIKRERKRERERERKKEKERERNSSFGWLLASTSNLKRSILYFQITNYRQKFYNFDPGQKNSL